MIGCGMMPMDLGQGNMHYEMGDEMVNSEIFCEWHFSVLNLDNQASHKSIEATELAG